MTPLAAVLALALAAGPSSSPRRTGEDVSNAARAKAGLLPRKAARTAVRAGYRVVRLPSPTFLPEPAPPAEDSPRADEAPAVAAAPEREPSPEQPLPVRAPELITADEPRVAARGPTVTQAVLGSVGEPEPAPAAPDEPADVRASARGVVTEVTLSLRFDP